VVSGGNVVGIQDLRQALATLSPVERELIVLRFVLALDYPWVALPEWPIPGVNMDISLRGVRFLETIDALCIRLLCFMLVASESSTRGAHFGVTCEAYMRGLAPGLVPPRDQ
jgi:hypothetical protein